MEGKGGQYGVEGIGGEGKELFVLYDLASKIDIFVEGEIGVSMKEYR